MDFLIGFHSKEGSTATTRHGITKKKKEKGKEDKHIGKLSRNDPKINPGI